MSLQSRIFNNEVNPEIPNEDIQNDIGYFFLFFLPGSNYNEDLHIFNLPDSWEQWSTTFADFNGMYETQFIGKLSDRDLVQSLLIQTLELFKANNQIRDYRIRTNHPSGYY